MDGFGNLSPADRAEAQELQQAIEMEAQFLARVHNVTELCWDKCVDSPGSKMDHRTESCVGNCAERFFDATLSITNRFAQMVQKGGVL